MGEKSKQKQNQVRSHSNWPCVLLFDLAHKQCNGIIKGWLHCHTSEWKGRFLVNNMLFGSAWCVAMAKIQFSLIKKIKIGLKPHPLSRITTYFCLNPLKVDVICVSPLLLHLPQLLLFASVCLFNHHWYLFGKHYQLWRNGNFSVAAHSEWWIN